MMLSSVNLRQAKVADLPSIHDLIRESYAAMNEITGEAMKEMWEKGAEKAIASGDLVEESFIKTYLTTPGANFWIAEVNDGGVVGCVGLKRTGLREGDLVRMSVTGKSRSLNIGNKLVSGLEEHCIEHNIERVHLVTANTRAASFYQNKCKFSLTHGFTYDAFGVTMKVAKMTKFLSPDRPVKNVVVVGGTHGNERIGVELVEAFRRDPSIFQRPTLKVSAVLGNEQAVTKNVRYIDKDLNRQFLTNASIGDDTSVEATRAKELLEILGPKSTTEPSAAEFIMDLHSSTSNVGLVSMISAADYDPLALYVASRLRSKLDPEMPYRITTSEGGKETSWSVDSISSSGIAFEVGALAHGTLGFRLYDQTLKMVLGTLDLIEERNQRLAAGAVDVTPSDFALEELFTQVKAIEYPPEPGFIIHPDLESGENFKPIRHGDPAFISTDGKNTVIPFVHPNAPKEGETTGGAAAPSAAKPLTELFTMFVNEAAYRERNIAFAVYEKKVKPVLFA